MTGMMWFDNNPATTLAQKIQKASDYYAQKFGTPPTLCKVHPDEYDPNTKVDGLKIEACRVILPGHLWLECEIEKSWKSFTSHFDLEEILEIQHLWEHDFETELIPSLLAYDPLVTLWAIYEIKCNIPDSGANPNFKVMLQNEQLSQHLKKFVLDEKVKSADILYAIEINTIKMKIVSAKFARQLAQRKIPPTTSHH